MLGPVSGAHFSPAVTLVFAIKKQISRSEAVLYVLVQVAAGLVGVWTAHMMFEESIFQISQKVRSGGAQWFSEGVATFGLIVTILATLKARESAVAMAVGLYITAAYWFTASTSFANPAVTIARGFSDTFAGIRPQDVPWFIVAQLIAAIIALVFCNWLLQSSDRNTQ